MRGIRGVGPVDPSRYYDLKRGFFFFHNSYLPCRCLASQQKVIFPAMDFVRLGGDIKKEWVECFSRWMVIWDIKRGKIVIFGLYLRPLFYAEAETYKDAAYLVDYLGKGMFGAYFISGAR